MTPGPQKSNQCGKGPAFYTLDIVKKLRSIMRTIGCSKNVNVKREVFDHPCKQQQTPGVSEIEDEVTLNPHQQRMPVPNKQDSNSIIPPQMIVILRFACRYIWILKM